MRVLVTVCGIGLGHATRIVAVLNELKKKGKVKVVASGIAQKYLTEAGYPARNIKSIDFESESFTFNTFSTLVDNMDLPMNFTRNYFTLSDIIDDFKPDVLLCDSEPTSFVISKMKRVKLAVLTNLFSSMAEAKDIPEYLLNKNSKSQMIIIEKLLNTVMKYSNVVINPSFIKRTSLSEKLKFTGLIVRDKPEDIKSENLLRKRVGEDFYLVSFGGSSFGNALFDQLSELLTEFSDKKFVISSGFRARSKRKYKNLTIFPFISNYLEHLKMCKGLISTAGYSTLSEAFVYRKPSMIIPIHNHVEQMGNARLFDRLGVANACFLKGPNDLKTLRKELDKFFSDEDKYRKKIETMKVNSNGAAEAVDIISSL
jgi:uncharacterized protein (TIGR00661 family)